MSRCAVLVRPASQADVSAVSRITLASPGAPQWTQQDYQRILYPGDPDAALVRVLLVAERGTEVLGFVVVSALTTLYPVEAELESIAVLPDARGQGMGRALLDGVFAWAQEHRANSMRLEVRMSNTAAQRLYRAAGFTDAGQRRGYYSQPAEDALLMERPIATGL